MPREPTARDTAERRAAERRSWPVQVLSLTAAESEDDGFVDAPVGELVAMVYTLTMAAWAMSGQPLPDYSRAEMPGRVIRGAYPP